MQEPFMGSRTCTIFVIFLFCVLKQNLDGQFFFYFTIAIGTRKQETLQDDLMVHLMFNFDVCINKMSGALPFKQIPH